MFNTKIDLCVDAISYLGINSYGKLYIGDNGIEFYNHQNINDYILIPYSEVECVIAQVIFNRWINRFVIKTKKISLSFSTKNNKETLRAISKHIGKDNMYKSANLIKILIYGIKRIFRFKCN